jgi:hypothetical protein
MGANDEIEIKTILGLIPQKNARVEERAKVNADIRQRLSKASNDVVAYLAIGYRHQLSIKELKSRFKKDEFKNLSELFRLANWTLEAPDARFVRDAREWAAKQVCQMAGGAPQSEIVEIMRDFISTQVVDRTQFPDYMICGREDMEEILEQIKDFRLGSTNLDDTIRLIRLRKAERELEARGGYGNGIATSQ